MRVTESNAYALGAGVLAIAVPLLLWWIAAGVLRRGDQRPFFAVISGADARLSLSRLQAFLWTFAIVGSYVAAMFLHSPIDITMPAEAKRIEDAYTKAEADLAAARAALALKEADLASKTLDVKGQTTLFSRADTIVNTENDPAAKKVAAEQLQRRAVEKRNAEWAREDALVARDEAKRAVEVLVKEAAKAKAAWRRTKWVAIPAELLALAGISLASGVFASVISATAKTDVPPALVTNVAFANGEYTISGSGFGKEGEVRLGGRSGKPRVWSDTVIVVSTDAVRPNDLIVDTAGTKVAHELTWSEDQVQAVPPAGAAATVSNIALSKDLYTIAGSGFGVNPGTVQLGGAPANVVDWKDTAIKVTSGVRQPTTLQINAVTYTLTWTPAAPALGGRVKRYEWGDLFRDDDNPAQFSLMKLQMFAWTVIALGIYLIIFARAVMRQGEGIDSLPLVDATLVLLTGLSQAGYLGGKAVSARASR